MPILCEACWRTSDVEDTVDEWLKWFLVEGWQEKGESTTTTSVHFSQFQIGHTCKEKLRKILWLVWEASMKFTQALFWALPVVFRSARISWNTFVRPSVRTFVRAKNVNHI